MNNSNQTLRFSRTTREAYGSFINFEPDRNKSWMQVILIGAALVIGYMLGRAG